MRKMMLIMSALLVACCTVSFARTDLKKSKVAVLKRNEIVRVYYEGLSTSVVEVSIKDNEGHEIFNEEVKAKSFVRPYNFSELPRGTYRIDITDNSGKHIERVLHYDRAYLGHATKLDTDKDKYLVAIPKKGNEEVTICVFDSQDNLVFSEVARDKDYAKVYHLKNLEGARIQFFDKD